MTLGEVLAAAAAELPDVVAAAEPSGEVEWSVAGVTFAVLAPDGGAAAFLLDPIVAGAAARTPDVVATPGRGPGWVELRPRIADGHMEDRARAWFLSGHRRLTGPGA